MWDIRNMHLYAFYFPLLTTKAEALAPIWYVSEPVTLYTKFLNNCANVVFVLFTVTITLSPFDSEYVPLPSFLKDFNISSKKEFEEYYSLNE